jgi:multiple sugar transport system permease protein
MGEIIDFVVGLLTVIGVPEAFRPIGSFVVLMAVVFVLFLVPLSYAVRRRWVSRSTAAFWVFVSPWVFGFLVFTAGPMIYSFVIALFDWDLLTTAEFIGLDNYVEASQDPLVAKSLSITLTYAVVSVPLQVLLSLGVALLMNVKVRGINIFRTLWYLPSLVTGVAQVALFLWVFNPRYGLVNGVLAIFGIEGPLWFRDPDWALPAVILMSLWTVGGNMVIYLAGLQDVPAELHEAAQLDGAGQLRRFWNITLPSLSPIIFFNVVTGLIAALQTFTQGYVVQAALGQGSGSGGSSLLFFVLYLYENAFQYFRMGYASALAWILFVMIVLLTLLVFRGSSFWVYYESARPTRRTRSRRVRAQ